ncbi:unnamed protein product [Camellia sinensis]
MHGRPRKAPTREEEKVLAPKAAKLRPLQSHFLHFHHNKILALAKNYRCYGVWYHRKWVLSKGHSFVDQKLQLLGVFLKKDSRNFHAWNYRRFVAALKNRSDEEELHFTTDLINENFSNYSSWHNCSVILSHLLEKRAQGSFSKEKVLTEEYDLIHQALFTNPDDQSGWFYHLWLLEQTVKVENPLLVLPGHLVVLILMYQQMVSWILLKFPSLGNLLIQPHGSQHAEMESAEMISWGDENFHTGETHLQEPTQIKNFNQLRNSEVNESTASKWSAETIVNEIALFRELLSEINWYLMLARLLTTHDAMMSYDKTPETCKMVHSEEVKELYSDLMTLDPPHSQYYKDEYSLVVLKQLTSSPESLPRHCCHYRDSASSGTNNYICLRLNNLSLSHIRSIEKLLWAQMLDLSHNQLSSIEGLQAMQLLSCLNLSNNKMRSFSAPEPLKLLKSLKVLDISYNEIGAHAVDTRSGVNVTNYWEVFAIFKDSKLTQLDIIGNVVAEEEFKLFLVKILPELNWLDGVELH